MTENEHPLTGTERRLTLDPCLHRQREIVGSNHGALFQRCVLCNSVLVSQSGRVWVFPATPR